VSQFRKTKMCRFHEVGRCRYGDQCHFAHDPSELKELTDLHKISMCEHCEHLSHGDNVHSAHWRHAEELRHVHTRLQALEEAVMSGNDRRKLIRFVAYAERLESQLKGITKLLVFSGRWEYLPVAAKKVWVGYKEAEAEILGKVSHSNVVKLLTAFSDGSTFWLITRHAGLALPNAPKLPSVFEVSNQVARGLAHIHRHGYVHRDVKSDNLTLDANIVKIIDFGQGIGLGNEPHDDSPEMALLLVRSVRSAALFLASEEAEASRRLAAILIQDPSARPTAKDVTLIAQRLSNSAPSGFTGVLLVFSVSDICKLHRPCIASDIECSPQVSKVLGKACRRNPELVQAGVLLPCCVYAWPTDNHIASGQYFVMVSCLCFGPFFLE
ncbi:SRK2, partial [Symbiodinium sp. KB8]